MARPVRIGVLVPSTNQVVEPDFASLMPPGVTYHTERLWNGEATPEGGGDGSYLLKMNDDLERGVRYLASANLDIIAYCCTSGTYHAGSLEYDGHLSRRISAAGGACLPLRRLRPPWRPCVTWVRDVSASSGPTATSSLESVLRLYWRVKGSRSYRP